MITSIIALHVGIDLILGLTEFGLAMMVANIAFTSGLWLRGLVSGIQQPSADSCSLADRLERKRSRLLALAADPDRVLDPIDQSSATAVVPAPSLDPAVNRREPFILVRRDGRSESGCTAVLTLSWWLPSILADRAARNRPRCAVHTAGRVRFLGRGRTARPKQ